MKPKYSILVIDDQQNWRELMAEILFDQFEVKSAESYESALEIIRVQGAPFHVIVTDMRLRNEEKGNEDGLKLIEYLNRKRNESKTIVVTGYATVDTAKRALSSLAVYDYLEKRPSDGSAFDYIAFEQIVYQAAREAEKQRQYDDTDISNNILVIDPDLIRCLIIKDVLQKDGYQVTTLPNSENLVNNLQVMNQDYALMLINETISSAVLLNNLQHTYINAKIIILTAKNIGGIINVMREYPVLTAFVMPGEQFNHQDFRDLVHSALSKGAKKYILIRSDYNHSDQFGKSEINLTVGEPCKINLLAQDAPVQNALLISLLPNENKKKKMQLHLFIHTENIKVEPDSEMYWEIPFSNKRNNQFEFTIIPQKPGINDLTIEIDQNHFWMGRINMVVNAMQSK